MGALDPWPRVLIVAAVPAEARAIWTGLGGSDGLEFQPWTPNSLHGRWDVVASGVGKACAAGCIAHLAKPGFHRAVLNAGVGGALPGSGLCIGDTVIASESVNADEGLAGPAGFVGLAAMSIRLGADAGPFPGDPALVAALAALGLPRGAIATVSTCSGTDAGARETVARTGATVEAMEGAAAALACRRLGLPFSEVRTVSNTTGDRALQRWDLPAALSALAAVMGRL